MDEKLPARAGARRILAPHILPGLPASPSPGGEGPLYYLSWPGWEIFLSRRLGLAAGPGGPRPLLLPDAADAETDFQAIDQLNMRASQLGAGLFSLAADSPESLPALLGSIRSYRGEEKPGPALDDRAYLALWAINEHQRRQSEALLAEARIKEKEMWAALKGEEVPSPPSPARLERPLPEPDRRALYAWRAWRRLAAGLLGPDDLLVPTAPGVE